MKITPQCKMLLHPSVAKHMFTSLAACFPHEGCGLLAGSSPLATRYLPVRNISQNPRRSFEMDPRELVMALEAIGDAGLELFAFVHSHTKRSKNQVVPSALDLQYEKTLTLKSVHIIVSWVYLDLLRPIALGWHYPGTPIRLETAQHGSS